ncbi:MAG: hypothetical protein OQK48_08515 [Sulfurimonas sp.]|uniref:hypothetical protein n=1 Tax=Sulfurimonas sp. TaxID=2022749 RepID=UPI00262A496B|nr:hypothetical protein [Sulfurimonas sp.]MCW8894893.1 hypothetical protein [Sulfurimonas sp.]MCW8954972.1 hypothetical protein [Sulfurimonas sp.]
MDSKEDVENHHHNLLYFNQMVEKGGRGEKFRKPKKQEPSSFSSQKVELSDYLTVPEGYEGIAYALYFLLVPYITGLVFLFIFIAGGSFENFALLDSSAFLIVWMIGYEIVASCILIAIFISYLRYDKSPKKRRH